MSTTAGTPAIDHLGWAVRSIDSSRAHFESGLGLEQQSDERFPDVRVAFFGRGPTFVELLEPLTPESDVGRFIARRGEGLHHLALRVDDVAAALADASRHGFGLIDEAPRPGARGTTDRRGRSEARRWRSHPVRPGAPGPVSLDGKTALVTGGTRGIGLAIVRALRRDGRASDRDQQLPRAHRCVSRGVRP